MRGELFNPGFIGRPKFNREAHPDFQLREVDPVGFLDKLIGQSEAKLLGFRLFDGHDDRVLSHVLSDTSCAKIVLRRDPLHCFLSRQIVSQTDQWRLADVAKRKESKVVFDPEEFEAFRDRQNAYYGWINQELQQRGQTAFWINFQDLQDVEIWNGVFKYLGVNDYKARPQSRLIRQNPEPLEEKVSNPEAIIPYATEETLPAPPVSKIDAIETSMAMNLTTARGADLSNTFFSEALIKYVKKGARARATKIDTSDLKIKTWQMKHPEHEMFFCVEDPVHRAYRAFDTYVLRPPHGAARHMRRNLILFYGLDWDLDHILEVSPKDYSLANYVKDFKTFLRFLEKHLLGQTRSKPHHDWNFQYLRLQAIQSRIPRTTIVEQRLDSNFSETKINLPTFSGLYSLAEFLDEDIINLVGKAYAEDIFRFGLFDQYVS
ncbi:MAG: hypothetical protein AAF198_03575 [Pseudomonadota bacterium]